jgi:lipooligosaccharide transport system permease protein
MDGIPFIQFLATGLLVTSAMFTASFECTYGTFIRLEFDKVYDGMLAAPISVSNLFLGEILWAGTKGFFFSLAVLIILLTFGVVSSALLFFAPLIGFLTGLMFASFSLFITSYIRNINYFNFYFTGFLSPMFFFSGVVFPITNLPLPLQYLAEVFPLTHSIRLVRSIALPGFETSFFYDLSFILIFISVFTFLAIRKLEKRLID